MVSEKTNYNKYLPDTHKYYVFIESTGSDYENDYSKCGTHYHNKYIKPWWADEMVVTTVIGNHKFLK